MSRSELFEGFVLAGGKSSRMGTDKAFLRIGEKTFVENAIEALKPNCQKVSVVLNKTQTDFIDKLPPETPYIFDIFENRGALGGIHAALENCKTEFAIILAVDLPFVTNEAIEQLCEIILKESDFSAIVPRQIDGNLQPLCAVYGVENCLFRLEEILAENNSASARYFLETVEMKIIDAETLGSDRNLFANLNAPQDLENSNNFFSLQ